MNTPTSPSAEPVKSRSLKVPLNAVEKTLSSQLKEIQGEQQAPVQRVRMSNLVIYYTSPEQAADVLEQIPAIVAVHPARVLILVGDPNSQETGFSATVSVTAQWLGQRVQGYSEQIILNAPGRLIDRLPFAVRSLVIGDLPTNLWWAVNQPPPLGGPFLFDLSENAQQIIYDSSGWLDPARGVAATARWLESTERASATHWRVCSDLNWRRLKYWRRLISQALDSLPAGPNPITELLFEHGPHAVVQAWELAGWMTQRLGWQVLSGKVQPGVEMSWRFARPKVAGGGEGRVCIRRADQGPAEIRHIRVAYLQDNHPFALNAVVEGPRRLAVTPEGVEGQPRTLTLPPLTCEDLIGRQLSDRERDPVFRASMQVAQAMAQSLLH